MEISIRDNLAKSELSLKTRERERTKEQTWSMFEAVGNKPDTWDGRKQQNPGNKNKISGSDLS